MTKIHDMIIQTTNLYEKINSYFKIDPCKADMFQVIRQEEYYILFQELTSIETERLIIDMITTSTSIDVLNCLCMVLNENIAIYEQKKDIFNSLSTSELLKIDVQYRFDDKLEMIQNEKSIIQDSKYPTTKEKETLLAENNREKNILQGEKTKYSYATAKWFLKNYYELIYIHSKNTISIIDRYFPVSATTITNETISMQSGVYFDMGLIYSIHKECNDEQFEDIPEVDLYTHFNLLPTNTTLKIKDKEKTRVCFLVHKLYKHLKSNERSEWLTAILKKLDISEGYYKSKYKEPVCEIPSQKSEQFAKIINDIFK